MMALTMANQMSAKRPRARPRFRQVEMLTGRGRASKALPPDSIDARQFAITVQT